MSKSLYELGIEYEESIELAQASLKKTRVEIIAAKKAQDHDRVHLLTREMAVLYEEIVDMRTIAEKLKNYHNPEKGRRVKNDYQQTCYS